MRRAVIAVLLAFTPPRWRESIAGDFEEGRGGALATLLYGARVVARLWIEEAIIRRETPMRKPFIHTTGFHLRQAIRSLVKRPAYSLIVIATLAIGIGANAAVFGLANWLMFRPVPAVHESDRLATVRLVHPSGGVLTISHPEMNLLRDHARGITAIAGSMEAEFNVANGGDAKRINGGIVSANYFDVLGVRPFAGRAFSPNDPGVVVSHTFWKTQMSAASSAVGAGLLVNGKPLTVLGIAPEGFAGTSRSSSVELWVPTTLRTAVFPGSRVDPLTSFPAGIYIELIARLAPGTSAPQVQAVMDGMPAVMAKLHPRPQRYKVTRFVVDEGLSSRGFERERLGRVFSLLMAMVGLLLVLACANVGNVMLAAGAARRSELATRQALGASRRQVVAAVFLESVMLALAGGVVAIALAWLVSTLMRGTIVLPFLPALGAITLDARVFAFAFALSTISAVAAGLLPALSATRFDLISTLKGTGRSVTQSGRRMRKTLTMAQVAVSLTLLVGALLLARSVHERRNVELGFDAGPLMTFSVDPGLHGRDAAVLRAFHERVRERVASIPGVTAVAPGWSRPFGLMANDGDIRSGTDAGRAPVSVEIFGVGTHYFETMRIPLLAGRGFADDEVRADQPRVAVLSESAARQLFGSAGAAIGQSIGAFDDARLTVVGVAANARIRRAFEPPPDAMYQPLAISAPWATYHVRSSLPESALVPLVRAAVRDANPSVPVFDAMSVRAAVDRQMSEEILIERLAIGFAVIATLLAAVGLYGVLAQSVTERRVEIGIRAALGAGRSRTVGLITSEAGRMTMGGAAAGLVLAAWLSRYLESRLYGVERFDPLTFAAALVLITAISLASAIVPALRATRVDPVVALRQ